MVVAIFSFALWISAAPRGAFGSTDYAFITTTDFITGSASVIRLDASYTTINHVASLHSDAVARYFGGCIYVVNRFGGDNIQVLDPTNHFATVRQFSVGNGSDPHDIAFVSETKAYVTRYNTTDLWIVNPSNGVHTGSIDLSSLSDADGIPEMDQMILIGNHLFVTLQRLDRNNFWLPSGTSTVAVVDVTADTLVDVDGAVPGPQSIELVGTDPFSEIQLDPHSGILFVSCVGRLGVVDDGVEAIDPATFAHAGYLLREADAGGDINDVEIVSPEKGYAIVTDANFHNVLITFDPRTGAKTGTLYAPGDFVLNDIEVSPGKKLFVADRSPTLPGIRIYDTATDVLITASPIDVGLPPFDITFSIPAQTGIGGSGDFAWLGQNYPNPFNPLTTIPFTLARDVWVRLTIYDAAGRPVKRVLDEMRSAGPQSAVWHGENSRGETVGSGVYFVVMEAETFRSAKKIVLVR